MDGEPIYKEDIETILTNSGYFTEVPEDITLDTELTTTEENGNYPIKVSEIYEGELKDKPPTVGEVLIPNTDESVTAPEEKSPYIKYNNILCRVLYNDETHGLQIVSADNIKEGEEMLEITLGYNDPTVTADDFVYNGSLNVSDSFKKAAASYNNAVDTLNNKAKEYMGEKAIDARSVGSIATLENGKFQGDTSGMFTGTETYLTTYGWNGKFKNMDTNYEEDVNQINDLGLNATVVNTWLASRYVASNSSNTLFKVRCMDNSGSVFNYLCIVYSYGGTNSLSYPYGFRPVFLLPSDILITGGDGSLENPYLIE